MQCGFEKRGGAATDFCLREGKQGDDFHAAGEALRDLRQDEQIGGAGKQESAGLAVFVDLAFDGAEQIGGALHFVDGDTAKAAEESGRIAARRGQESVVVHGEEVALVRDQIAREGGFAALARAGDHDHRGIGQGGGDQRSSEAWIELGHRRVFPFCLRSRRV